MNYSLLLVEMLVAALGLGVLLADLWLPVEHRRKLGYAAAAGLLVVFFLGLTDAADAAYAFVAPGAKTGMFVSDSLAVFFKEFFLLAGILVLLMSVEFSDRITTGLSEFYSLTLFALLGMLFAASANDFVLMFAALELITITFVVLNSYQRGRAASIEAGVKYLILGALASAFMVFGIAFVFGSANTTNFNEIFLAQKQLIGNPVFLAGLVLVLAGLAFKIAAVPFQVWAPDVYQGAPAPATAFLAVGSKAAGIVLLLRVLFGVVPQITSHFHQVLIWISGLTILYGSLCAIPQRSLKRLMGYSSIANAGYLLLGFASLSKAGASGILYYLAGYLFTVLAAFTVVVVILRYTESDDLSSLSGLGQRSPILAGALTLSMVSLAGVPPLAGFLGKFLLLKSIIPLGAMDPSYYGLLAVAVLGVVISIYYYFGVIRAIYWAGPATDLSPIPTSWPVRLALAVCVLGMFWLGLLPDHLVQLSTPAVEVLRPESPALLQASGR
jgi:NADH-quinone oxidoreductase subunit N